MPDTETWILAVHATATWSMVGVIWFVQVVHYPLVLGRFAQALGDEARSLQSLHMQRTTYVVAPLMFAEATTAVGLWAMERSLLTTLGLLALAICWGSTALFQVPCHRRLEESFDQGIADRLVRSNWIRTIAWSTRGLLAAWIWLEAGLG